MKPRINISCSTDAQLFICLLRRIAAAEFELLVLRLALTIWRACRRVAFGLQPIIKLIAWKAAAFEIDFIRAELDLFTTWCVVSGSTICVRLKRACPNLRSLTSLAPVLRCHIDLNPFLFDLRPAHSMPV